jgi:hypothetical protein
LDKVLERQELRFADGLFQREAEFKFQVWRERTAITQVGFLSINAVLSVSLWAQ